MKVIAVNGSPRKTWNTATLLEHALAGAAGSGAETELVHLYDLEFKGCISCFACKKIPCWPQPSNRSIVLVNRGEEVQHGKLFRIKGSQVCRGI